MALALASCTYDYKVKVDTDTITYVINHDTGDIYQKMLSEENPILFIPMFEEKNKQCLVKGIWRY